MFIFQEQKSQFLQGVNNFSVSKLNVMYFFQFLFTGLMMIPLELILITYIIPVDSYFARFN